MTDTRGELSIEIEHGSWKTRVRPWPDGDNEIEIAMLDGHTPNACIIIPQEELDVFLTACTMVAESIRDGSET